MHAATIESPRLARVQGLYGITPGGLATEVLVARVDAAVRGGASVIQYRDKEAAPGERRERARALAQLLAGRALLIVNDDPALAADVGADGVHVGEDDGSLIAARKRVGPARLIGVSCYNDFARAPQAIAAGADHVAFGSFFASRVKPQARVAHLSLLTQGRALGVPVVAIGGIDASNAATLVAAGADAVAVISALFAHPTLAAVEDAARALVAAVEQGRARRPSSALP
jgi:thiamine-phosphate pyrophosphorylase